MKGEVTEVGKRGNSCACAENFGGQARHQLYMYSEMRFFDSCVFLRVNSKTFRKCVCVYADVGV